MVAGNTVGSGQQTLCTDGKSQCLSVISFVYSALLDVGVWPSSSEVKQRGVVNFREKILLLLEVPLIQRQLTLPTTESGKASGNSVS